MGKSVKKLNARQRRKYRIRGRLRGTADRPRLSVFRSDKYTYAQIISDDSGKTLAAVSTKDADVQKKLKELEGGGDASTKSALAAKAAGLVLAEKAKSASLEAVVFDRGGYLYHGRVKSLANCIHSPG